MIFPFLHIFSLSTKLPISFKIKFKAKSAFLTISWLALQLLQSVVIWFSSTFMSRKMWLLCYFIIIGLGLIFRELSLPIYWENSFWCIPFFMLERMAFYWVKSFLLKLFVEDFESVFEKLSSLISISVFIKGLVLVREVSCYLAQF